MRRTFLLIVLAFVAVAELWGQTTVQPDIVKRDAYLKRKLVLDSIAVPADTPPAGRAYLFGRGTLGIYVKFCDGSVARLDSAGTAGVADSLKNLRNPTGVAGDTNYVYAKSGQWVEAAMVGTANGWVIYDSSGVLVNAFERSNIEGDTYALPANDVDCSLRYHTYRKSISSNTTFTFSNLKDGKWFIVAVTNTGSYTVSWPTITWKGTGAAAPTQTANKTDFYRFVRMNGVTYGAQDPNY